MVRTARSRPHDAGKSVVNFPFKSIDKLKKFIVQEKMDFSSMKNCLAGCCRFPDAKFRINLIHQLVVVPEKIDQSSYEVCAPENFLKITQRRITFISIRFAVNEKIGLVPRHFYNEVSSTWRADARTCIECHILLISSLLSWSWVRCVECGKSLGIGFYVYPWRRLPGCNGEIWIVQKNVGHGSI